MDPFLPPPKNWVKKDKRAGKILQKKKFYKKNRLHSFPEWHEKSLVFQFSREDCNDLETQVAPGSQLLCKWFLKIANALGILQSNVPCKLKLIKKDMKYKVGSTLKNI